MIEKSKQCARIVLQCLQWGRGFGVSTVVAAQARALADAGWKVEIHCRYYSDRGEPLPAGVAVRRMPIAMSSVAATGAAVVIAHTSPYHWRLRNVRGAKKVLWDHGEPPPEWFPGETELRKEIDRRKRMEGFPVADQVVAISEFIRRSSGWNSARVIYNGADHLWSMEKGSSSQKKGRIRLLCVSRMSEGERNYKGLDDLAWIAGRLGSRADIIVVGKGSARDKEFLEGQGLAVRLNVSRADLADLYASSDAVLSFSRWEGFNLPLVEGAFFGTAGIALDLGPHREVTPFVFANREELLEWILERNRVDFLIAGQEAQRYSHRFTWARHGDELVAMVEPCRRIAQWWELLVWKGVCIFAEAIFRSTEALRNFCGSRRND